MRAWTFTEWLTNFLGSMAAARVAVPPIGPFQGVGHFNGGTDMKHIEFPDLTVIHDDKCPFVPETFYDPGIDCTCRRNRDARQRKDMKPRSDTDGRMGP